MIKLRADNIAKHFGQLLLFRGISFELSPGESFYITGKNGSGKSTLIQIAAGIQLPSSGNITWTENNVTINREDYLNYSGFTGPQVNPYDMLTAYENLEFASSMITSRDKIESLLTKFGIYSERKRLIKHYSSGMKQRVRIISAIINDPPLLFLDEPGSNLDLKGKDILYSTIEEMKKGRIIVIATNEPEEMKLCSRGITLDDRNN